MWGTNLWSTIPGYRPLWQGSQGGKNLKQLVTSCPHSMAGKNKSAMYAWFSPRLLHYNMGQGQKPGAMHF